MSKKGNVHELKDLNMPIVILLTDATYPLISKLSSEPIDITLVDEGMSFVWLDENKYNLYTKDEFDAKYELAFHVGNVIYLATEG